ncbi:MAG: HAMP domain-containing sensor histidine kinase, partial [Bacteroidota bacterium]
MKDSLSSGFEHALVRSMSENPKGKNNSHLSREQLLRLNLALQEELQELAYAVSHDLEEPLRHVMSFSNLLAKRAKVYGDDDIQKFSAVVQSSGKNLESRLKAILEISRLARFEIKEEVVDTESLIKEIVERKKQQEGYQTQVHITSLPKLKTTPKLFKIICEELLKNAFHFSSQESNPSIHVYAENQGGDISINIEDNGIGMGEQTIE